MVGLFKTRFDGVQFSPLTGCVIGVCVGVGKVGGCWEGGHDGRLSTNPFLVFYAGGHCQKLWRKQGCEL